MQRLHDAFAASLTMPHVKSSLQSELSHLVSMAKFLASLPQNDCDDICLCCAGSAGAAGVKLSLAAATFVALSMALVLTW